MLFELAYRKIEKPVNHKTRNTNGDINAMVKLNKIDHLVMNALKGSKELTFQEIADKTGEKPKKIFKSLRKLFENELIETNARKYKLAST